MIAYESHKNNLKTIDNTSVRQTSVNHSMLPLPPQASLKEGKQCQACLQVIDTPLYGQHWKHLENRFP